MTDTAWVCVDPKTGEEDHDWKYKSDWSGDPGVIGGTYTFYSRACSACGKMESVSHDDMPYEDWE